MRVAGKERAHSDTVKAQDRVLAFTTLGATTAAEAATPSPTTAVALDTPVCGTNPIQGRNTIKTLFQPRIISLCHDVCDTLMSRFSARACYGENPRLSVSTSCDLLATLEHLLSIKSIGQTLFRKETL